MALGKRINLASGIPIETQFLVVEGEFLVMKASNAFGNCVISKPTLVFRTHTGSLDSKTYEFYPLPPLDYTSMFMKILVDFFHILNKIRAPGYFSPKCLFLLPIPV